MQEFRPELSEEELEQHRKFLESITANPEAIDRKYALFNGLRKEQMKSIKDKRRDDNVQHVDIGTVKSVGGVDYEFTEKGWKKIGLTKA